MLGITNDIPKRVEYIRVLVAELNRLASHFVAIGTYGLDIGAFTPFLWLMRDREHILRMLEWVSGARMLYNYMWVGGLYFSTRSTPSIRSNVSSGSSSRSTTLCCGYAALKHTVDSTCLVPTCSHTSTHAVNTPRHTACSHTRARAVDTPLHTTLLCPHDLVSWRAEPSQATPPRPSSTTPDGRTSTALHTRNSSARTLCLPPGQARTEHR